MIKHLSCFISLAFALLHLYSCGQESNSKIKSSGSSKQAIIDTPQYAILRFDTADTWLFKNVVPANLSQADVQELEILLNKFVNSYNPEQKPLFDSISKIHPEYNLKVNDFVIELSRYKRQYFPVVNSAGQKEIWVNCFCSFFDKNWRKEMLIVQDGGNCFFSLVINLTTKTFYRFIVNGEA